MGSVCCEVERSNFSVKIITVNPKHTGLFANLIIPGGDKFAQQLYRDNECPDKKNVKQTFLLLVN